MAERRMLAKTIIDSDAFLDMPMSARLLYYDFSMRADDDGFVNSPKKITRFTGASDDDIKVLIGKRFIIPFDTGVVVIKHWRIHNYIRKDTYTETKYKAEKASLYLDENNAYSLHAPQLSRGRDEPVDEPSTQVRLGKVRLGKYIPPIIPQLEQLHPEVQAAFADFIADRKERKEPMTSRAITLNVNKLSALSSNKDVQIAIIKQSIERGWKGLFEIKDERKTQHTGRRMNHSQRVYSAAELDKIGVDLLDKV